MLAIFAVIKSHKWLVVTILDNSYRVFASLWRLLLYSAAVNNVFSIAYFLTSYTLIHTMTFLLQLALFHLVLGLDIYLCSYNCSINVV